MLVTSKKASGSIRCLNTFITIMIETLGVLSFGEQKRLVNIGGEGEFCETFEPKESLLDISEKGTSAFRIKCGV